MQHLTSKSHNNLQIKNIMKKVGCIAGVVVLLILAGFIGFKYYWVFGEGVKAGELNYITHKGYIFKTYEGKIIQSGLRGASKSGETNGIYSNEFVFSVEKKEVADSLMRCSGKNLELHYKEYKGALPWRGISVYVVDSIISVTPARGLID